MSFVHRLARLQWQGVYISSKRNWQSSKSPAFHQSHVIWQGLRPNDSRFLHQSRSNEGSTEDSDAVAPKGLRKLDRPMFAQAPLRRAVQATRQQRQRETKEASQSGPSTFVTAYCAAEAYKIHQVADILRESGHRLNVFDANLAPHVVHFQKLSDNATRTAEKHLVDIFVLASGTVVIWGEIGMAYISTVLLPALTSAAENAHQDMIEIEDLEFREDFDNGNSYVNGDIITLGARTPNCNASKTTASSSTAQNSPREHETSMLLAKVAFSFGLARSTKIAILEGQLERYFMSTRDIPVMLKSGTKLPYSRQFVLRKIGELLSMRSQLNLSSELTDSLPNVFWDSRYELGLEEYFVQVSRALDIGVRIKALNEKMTYAQEIASVLQDRLSERHGFLLEWLIIALISVEICIEVTRLVKERLERNDPDNLDMVIRRYLERRGGD